jgi:hypothetical protein
MLIRRMPSILPPMSDKESLEVTKIYSASGKLNDRSSLIRMRPFRSPHHTISSASLIGVRVVRINLDVMKKKMDIMSTVFLFLAYSHYLSNKKPLG